MRPLCAARPLALESLYENMRAKRWMCSAAQLWRGRGPLVRPLARLDSCISPGFRSLAAELVCFLVSYWTLASAAAAEGKKAPSRCLWQSWILRK